MRLFSVRRLLAPVLLLGALVLRAAPAVQEKAVFHPILTRLLAEAKLQDAEGNRVDARRLSSKKYVFVYFSGLFCVPCRFFTPHLIDFHKEFAGNGDFEILLMDQDRTQDAMDRYMKKDQMPWVGLAIKDEATEAVQNLVGWQRGFPMLYLLDENDRVVAGPRPEGSDNASWNPVKVWQRLHGVPESHWDFVSRYKDAQETHGK